MNVDLQGFVELDAAFARAPEIVRAEMLAALTESDQLLEREVKELTPTATGASRASIFSREQLLPEGALGVVGSSQPHLVFVELGTQPHMPPIQPLEDWVRVKFGYTSEKQIHGAALAIARKIAARGTLGVGMFHRTWARHRPAVERRISLAHARIAQRMAGGAA